MKNKIRLFVVLGLFFMLPVVALATESGTSGYNEAILEEALQFDAVLAGNYVETSWTKFAPAGFNYYKVVRSTTNPDPVYPDDGYIQVTSDPDFTFYTDKDVPDGMVYYRVCSIAKPERYCSNVVALQIGEAEPVSKPELGNAVIDLEAFLGEKGVVLEWALEGVAPYGFKVVYSKTNAEPNYPGDSAVYLDDPNVRRFDHMELKAGYTYHYRVCQYNGEGACHSYSNPVAVTIPGDQVMDDPVTEKPTSENGDASDEYQALRDEIEALKAKVARLEEFVDVQTHRYEIAIDYLRQKGIVKGYDDGTYKPDNTINRAEFMKIVMGEKYGAELSTALADCFDDVGKEWYAAYVCLGKAKGIVNGYGDGKFKPGDQISFVEAAKILANVYGLDLGEEGTDWYERYVRALQSHGYIPSTVGQLNKPITRAEMAELIWRIREGVQDQDTSDLIDE